VRCAILRTANDEVINMPEKPLQRDFRWFIDHQDELVERYRGKVIAIKQQQVLGAFDSYFEAVEEVSKEHELGTFLTQLCEPGRDCYTARFPSGRVSFTP